MQGQMSLFDFIEPNEDEAKAGICQFCGWYDQPNGIMQTEGCMWQQHYPEHLDEEELKTHSCWMPQTRGMRVCATCKHSNDFIYDGEDMHNPEINNDLYCDLDDFYGRHPVNRKELFKKYRCKKEFGVGFYHRNHEYDTCDLWEADDVFVDGGNSR